MPFRWNPREHVKLSFDLVKWVTIAAPVAALIGSSVALFLWLLDWATITRWNNPWLLWLLPAAGVAIGLLYHWMGKSVEGGNNLIVEQIHEPGGGVPRRMAPLVLIGTIVTHLFGGSAGREGTAVQMGGSIASAACKALKLDKADVQTLLMVGIAAGFGAVFGTPLAGTIFAIEVLTLGQMNYGALIPCLIGAVVGDAIVTAWGVHHTAYHISAFAAGEVSMIDWMLLGKVALASAGFGLISVLFSELSHSVSRVLKWAIPWPALQPAAGGAAVIGLVLLLGTRDYLGLGVVADPHSPGGVSIISCFQAGGASPWSWWWKILFTVITVGSGFKGGEVTPLFFIGAALGNTLGWLMGAPVDLFAALGFVAVFAGATNTPLACTIMAVELFGKSAGVLASGFAVYAATACFISYLISGHSGIYLSQVIGTPKLKGTAAGASLRAVREGRPTMMTKLFGKK